MASYRFIDSIFSCTLISLGGGCEIESSMASYRFIDAIFSCVFISLGGGCEIESTSSWFWSQPRSLILYYIVTFCSSLSSSSSFLSSLKALIALISFSYS